MKGPRSAIEVVTVAKGRSPDVFLHVINRDFPITDLYAPVSTTQYISFVTRFVRSCFFPSVLFLTYLYEGRGLEGTRWGWEGVVIYMSGVNLNRVSDIGSSFCLAQCVSG